MTEPVVETPARLALLAGKHLYHLAPLVPSHENEIRLLSEAILCSVTDQNALAEVRRALVAAGFQESR